MVQWFELGESGDAQRRKGYSSCSGPGNRELGLKITRRNVKTVSKSTFVGLQVHCPPRSSALNSTHTHTEPSEREWAAGI